MTNEEKYVETLREIADLAEAGADFPKWSIVDYSLIGNLSHKILRVKELLDKILDEENDEAREQKEKLE